ncbi:hypothetical protein J7L02_01405 [Candidatus Woesearchaeota archaeon]|nr:hypothetical protein [Candidatus Woesearchaeota archaeon]
MRKSKPKVVGKTVEKGLPLKVMKAKIVELCKPLFNPDLNTLLVLWSGSSAKKKNVKGSDIDIIVVIDDKSKSIPLNIAKVAIIMNQIAKKANEQGLKFHFQPPMGITKFWELVLVGEPWLTDFVKNGVALYDPHKILPLLIKELKEQGILSKEIAYQEQIDRLGLSLKKARVILMDRVPYVLLRINTLLLRFYLKARGVEALHTVTILIHLNKILKKNDKLRALLEYYKQLYYTSDKMVFGYSPVYRGEEIENIVRITKEIEEIILEDLKHKEYEIKVFIVKQIFKELKILASKELKKSLKTVEDVKNAWQRLFKEKKIIDPVHLEFVEKICNIMKQVETKKLYEELLSINMLELIAYLESMKVLLEKRSYVLGQSIEKVNTKELLMDLTRIAKIPGNELVTSWICLPKKVLRSLTLQFIVRADNKDQLQSLERKLEKTAASISKKHGLAIKIKVMTFEDMVEAITVRDRAFISEIVNSLPLLDTKRLFSSIHQLIKRAVKEELYLEFYDVKELVEREWQEVENLKVKTLTYLYDAVISLMQVFTILKLGTIKRPKELPKLLKQKFSKVFTEGEIEILNQVIMTLKNKEYHPEEEIPIKQLYVLFNKLLVVYDQLNDKIRAVKQREK